MVTRTGSPRSLGATSHSFLQKTGDLIVWDWRLPHSNSKTLSTRPRLALRDTAIESWRGSRCVPWWWRHRGYDRIEPRPSARLSELDRRLIGLHAW
jgi:hypothetical protein